jgi:hypothetical protein
LLQHTHDTPQACIQQAMPMLPRPSCARELSWLWRTCWIRSRNRSRIASERRGLQRPWHESRLRSPWSAPTRASTGQTGGTSPASPLLCLRTPQFHLHSRAYPVRSCLYARGAIRRWYLTKNLQLSSTAGQQGRPCTFSVEESKVLVRLELSAFKHIFEARVAAGLDTRVCDTHCGRGLASVRTAHLDPRESRTGGNHIS